MHMGALALLAAVTLGLLIWSNRRQLRRIDRRLDALEHVLREQWERREAEFLVAHRAPAERRRGFFVVPKTIAIGGAIDILINWMRQKPITAVSVAGVSTALALVPSADPVTRLPALPAQPPMAAPTTPSPPRQPDPSAPPRKPLRTPSPAAGATTSPAVDVPALAPDSTPARGPTRPPGGHVPHDEPPGALPPDVPELPDDGTEPADCLITIIQLGELVVCVPRPPTVV